MIDDITIRRVKDSARIVDVVADYVQLKRSGAEYTGCCPFHDDRRTGSFMVNPNKNIATCFPCGKTWDAIAFIMDIERVEFLDAIRTLAKKFGVYTDETDMKPLPQVKSEPRPVTPALPKRTWPLKYVMRNMADSSDQFVRWMLNLPWNAAQRARLPKVLEAYFIGHSHCQDDFGSWHDFTVFWQVDHNFTLHNGHFMKYQSDGHRVKDKNLYTTTWLHARMKRAKQNPFNEEKEDKSFCLFGQHLMVSNPNAVINIVESEKTAVVMSVAYGGSERQVQMACCGLGMLTNSRDLLRPLIEANRKIVLYPDRDGVERWQEAARQIGYKNMSVNSDPVRKWWTPEDGDKADIADIILRAIRGERRTKTVQQDEPPANWLKDNENVTALIHKLKLERI